MKRRLVLAAVLIVGACRGEQSLATHAPLQRADNVLAFTGPPTANATVTYLGELATQPGSATPLAVNATGMIVGHACCSPQIGVIFTPPPVRTVPRPDISDVYVQIARGINDLDQFTGLGSDQFGIARAFVGGTGGPASMLPSIDRPDAAAIWGELGHDISNAGHVVGSTGFSGTEAHATLWRLGASGYTVEDLGLLNGSSTTALAIAKGSGDNPLIVGTTGSRAFMWQNGVYTLLPQVQGTSGSTSFPGDILDNGLVVGVDQTIGPGGAVLWREGQAIDLHPACLPLWPEGSAGPSVANGIAMTPSGRILIVGQCFGPTVWYDDGQGGFIAELLPLLTGDASGVAFDVNASGLIVGNSGNRAVAWNFTVPPLDGGAPPAAAFTSPTSVNEGSSFTLALNNPSGAGPFAYAFDCGGGSGTGPFGESTSASCPTADEDSRLVRGSIRDAAARTTEYTATVTINNVAPTVSVFAGATIIARETYVATGSVSDPGSDILSATVDYGTGTGAQSLALVSGGFTLNRRYNTPGTFVVQVAAQDGDGGAGTRQATVVVQSFTAAINDLLILTVHELVEAGTLTPQQGERLTVALERLLARLGNVDLTSHARAVTLALRVYTRALTKLVAEGSLQAETGEELIASAERIIAALNSP